MELHQLNIGDNLNRLTITGSKPIILTIREKSYQFIRFDGPRIVIIDRATGTWVKDFLTDEEWMSVTAQILSLEAY